MRLLLATACMFFCLTARAEEPSVLNPSGLPVPRFVSLKSDEVNVRVGPGKRYPIKYVYRLNQLPVKIVEEFAHWRKIADFEGTSGWVHKGMVDGKRTAMIIGGMQNLYADPTTESRVVLRAKEKVIGNLLSCEPDWCKLEINKQSGWIRKADLWGATREEVFSD